MVSFRRPAIIALSALLVAASGVVVLAATQADDEERGEVVFTSDHPLAQPEPGKALVYVVRPTSAGFAIKSWFFADDAVLGINRGSSYFFAQIEPGSHVFWSKSENVDALELKVEAGRTYYIQQHVRMGAFRARTKLEVLQDAEGAKALSQCHKHGAITAEGRRKGQELVAEHKDATRKDLERREREAKDTDD